jgi:signal transduction histidine kinase
LDLVTCDNMLQSRHVDIERLVNDCRCSDCGSLSAGHSADRSTAGGCGDPRLLQRVFENLLSNALTFSSKREHPLVQVGAEKGADASWLFRPG